MFQLLCLALRIKPLKHKTDQHRSCWLYIPENGLDSVLRDPVSQVFHRHDRMLCNQLYPSDPRLPMAHAGSQIRQLFAAAAYSP